MPKREESMRGDPAPEGRGQQPSTPPAEEKDDVFGTLTGFAVLIAVGVYVLDHWREMPGWVQYLFVIFAASAAFMSLSWCYFGFRHMQGWLFPAAYTRYEERCKEKERNRWEKLSRKAEASAALDRAVHPWLQRMLWFIASMLALLVAHFVFRLI